MRASKDVERYIGQVEAINWVWVLTEAQTRAPPGGPNLEKTLTEDITAQLHTQVSHLYIQEVSEPKQNVCFYYIAKAVITQKITFFFYFLKQTTS